MEVTVINDIIKSIDIVKGENEAYLEFSMKRGDDALCLPLVQSDYIKELLQLLNSEGLSKVKDVSVRLFGTIESEAGNNFELEAMAIGDLLEDKWLMFAEDGDAVIVNFDTLIEELGLQEVESVLMI